MERRKITMKRKLLIFSLIFAMLFSQVSVIHAKKNTEETRIEISTAEELFELAEACKLDVYSIGKVIELKADINLLGTGFEGIP